jgi:hypothetical protein
MIEAFRYVRVMGKRKFRSAVPMETRKTIKKTSRALGIGVFTTGALGFLAGTADYIAHANGHDGLTQGYVWTATQQDNCVHVHMLASHVVEPDEEVVLRLNSFIGEDVQGVREFDISGKPLALVSETICFAPEALPTAGIIFQATNGELSGAPETYTVSQP